MTAIDLEYSIQQELRTISGNTAVLSSVLDFILKAARKSNAESLKKALREECSEALKEMENVKAGKIEARTMEDLYKELGE